MADRDCGGGREDRRIVPGGFALDRAVRSVVLSPDDESILSYN